MFTWAIWLQPDPMEDIIVVSEIGEQWSPKIAPVNTALIDAIKNPNSGLIFQARGIASGIKIVIVPYAVPVANEIIAPKIKIKAGTDQ